MLQRPETRFVKSAGYSIAYQVFGDGPVDLIYMPAYFSNVEFQWFIPPLRRFLERLATFSRVIVLDLRNLGLSDGMEPGATATLEERVGDVLAVMGAAGAMHGVLFASQDSAFVAMLAAATHPDRFDSMVLFSASPSWVRSEELPTEYSEDQWQAQRATAESASGWIPARQYVRSVLPSMADDDEVVHLIRIFDLMSTTRGATAAETDRYRATDLREIVPSIRVPTLLLHRPEEDTTPIESARWLAEHLPDVRYVELPGRDGQPWGEGAAEVLDLVEDFVTGERREVQPERSLLSLLFTDIVDSTARAAELGDSEWHRLVTTHNEVVVAALREHRGREVDFAGDGVFATFDGPARAVRCAGVLVRRLREIGIDIRAGVHTGEVELDGSGVRGIAVHIGARVAGSAEPGEVLVTSTVRDLVAGSDVVFEDRGLREFKGVPDPWRVYAARVE